MPAAGMKFALDVKGMATLKKKLDPDNLVNPAILDVLNEAAEVGVSVAKSKAPVDTGALKRSITGKVQYPSATVFSPLDYASHVEYGTRGGAPTGRRYPPVSALRGWASRHGINPWVLMYKIGREGTKAQPFIKPASDAINAKLPLLVRDAAKAIAKGWKKKR
jgi:hypothetical protein